MNDYDEYKLSVDCFVNNLKCKDLLRAIILDGSVNNLENIAGFSDIDLKVIVKGNKIANSILNDINYSIHESIKNKNIVFNTWTLTDQEFPRSSFNSNFDFVRRYCLLKGTIVFGNIEIEDDLIKQIGIVEKHECIKALFNFQIRLRRLLTNASAISDVSLENNELLLQQSIAYFFHSLRYYNAFNGDVCLTIKKTLDVFCNKEKEIYDISFADKIYNLRNNWKDSINTTYSDAKMILYDVTNFINDLYLRMKSNITADPTYLFYK